MFICKHKENIAEDIFPGRNREWFNNMMLDRGTDNTYDYLNIHFGVSDEAPQSFSDKYVGEDGYFGFCYIKVEDFKDWFNKYRPDQDAGWVTRYEAWVYEHKGIEPEYLKKSLDKEDNIKDMQFIEVTNRFDCSAWLYTYLVNNNIPDDATIQYCFDW